MKDEVFRVGELAKRTGVSVRTLHHYDAIGLLAPSRRSESRHRLYDTEDVVRLQQIKSLRQLGFSLEEIRELLAARRLTPLGVVEMHLQRVKEQMSLQRQLVGRLESIAERLRAAEAPTADEMMKTIEVMTMFEKYFTEEQRQALKERGDKLGPDAIKGVEEEWPRLIAAVREEMRKGTDPHSEEVRALAKRWRELLDAFSGGNREMEASAAKMYREEPQVAQQYGLDAEVFKYIGEAMKSLS
jgi:DNA-binding transcriptional MerR regulator